MLSPNLKEKNHIFSICEKSGDIQPGTVFRSIRIADPDDKLPIPLGSMIVCIGRLADDEMLFSAANGRYYFSIVDGWGKQNHTLYGLEIGECYDLKHSTTIESAIDEFEMKAKPTYTTWCGAMAYGARIGTIKRILCILKKVKR